MFAGPLETDRLRLRALSADDATETYRAWMRDPDVLRYLEVRHAKPPAVEDLATYINGANASSNTILFGICRRDDGRHIGNIKLGALSQHYARGDLGFLIGDRPSWGRGFATEAIERVAEFALSDLGLRKVSAGCYEPNVGSAVALQRAGFSLEATLKDHWAVDGLPVNGLVFSRFSARVAP